MIDLNQIQQTIEDSEAGLEAKQAWNPEHCGTIDIRIAKDGTWYHEGHPIKRLPLVKLFASVLRREEDGAHYLVTPVEKMRIEVEDAPFIAHTLEITEQNGQQALVFTNNLDDQVIADADHPITVQHHPDTGEPRPYIRFRQNLEALIGRNAFLELANASDVIDSDEGSHLQISSMGTDFSLGTI